MQLCGTLHQHVNILMISVGFPICFSAQKQVSKWIKGKKGMAMMCHQQKGIRRLSVSEDPQSLDSQCTGSMANPLNRFESQSRIQKCQCCPGPRQRLQLSTNPAAEPDNLSPRIIGHTRPPNRSSNLAATAGLPRMRSIRI